MHAIPPVNLRTASIKRMHGLVNEGIRCVRLRSEMVRAEQDAAVVLESAGELPVAAAALDLCAVELAAAALEVLEHEAHGGVASGPLARCGVARKVGALGKSGAARTWRRPRRETFRTATAPRRPRRPRVASSWRWEGWGCAVPGGRVAGVGERGGGGDGG